MSNTEMEQDKDTNHYLNNQFLVSMPQMEDPNFVQTVILVCRHDENGAVGIVVNRLTEHLIGDIFDQLEIKVSSDFHSRKPVLSGGPVYPELGLIVHDAVSDKWESSIEIGDHLRLTSSRDILLDMAQGQGPERAIMSLGYAGWAAGQLEEEMKQNAWFTTPADLEILFDEDVEHKWRKAAALLGIDTNQFSSQVGHA